MKRIVSTCIIAILVLWGSVHAWADDYEKIPAKLRAVLILKVLRYDRNMEISQSKSVRIGIVYNQNVTKQKRYAQDLQSTFSSMSQRPGIDANISPVLIDESQLQRSSEVEETFADMDLDAIMLIDVSKNIFEDIIAASRKNQINTFTDHREDLGRGAAIGILNLNNKPKIYVNLESMREEGSDYGSKLLALSKQVGS